MHITEAVDSCRSHVYNVLHAMPVWLTLTIFFLTKNADGFCPFSKSLSLILRHCFHDLFLFGFWADNGGKLFADEGSAESCTNNYPKRRQLL